MSSSVKLPTTPDITMSASVKLPNTPDTSSAAKSKSTSPPAHLLIEEVKAKVTATLHLTPKDLPMCKTVHNVRVDHADHFSCDAITMARQLLGSTMVRVLPNGVRVSGKIIEVEAYLGVDDAAAHSFKGKRGTKNER